ncbi:hypothetical protein Hanom_Chr09g00785371 [Helianthus anomalus]
MRQYNIGINSLHFSIHQSSSIFIISIHRSSSIMASQETQGSSSTSVEKPPLWDYATKIEKQGVVGGTWKFKCNLCHETRQGSCSRVKAHLLRIKGNLCSVLKQVLVLLVDDISIDDLMLIY